MVSSPSKSYDSTVDVWSLGAVLFFMLAGGKHAFQGNFDEEIEDAILVGKYDES